MAQVTVEEFRERWVSDASGIEDAPITDVLDSARRYIKKHVKEAEYDAFVADSISDTASDLREAQHLLAHRAYLLIRGSRLKDGGIYKKESDPNSQSTVEFESVSEIEKLRAAHLAEANLILDSYLISEEVKSLSAFPTTGRWF